MKTTCLPICCACLGPLLACSLASAQTNTPAELFIRDDINDVGNEPNNQTTYFYISDDIWVRRSADPNYDPTPFPIASPTWTPLPYEDPCYRDPLTSSPNFIYVRVRNIGGSTSSGTETLHVYWAKASTGLNWPGDWNDHLEIPSCGGAAKLYGYEVTKPRKNGASATAAEKSDYVAAIQAVNTASHTFPDGVTYFNKQNQVHGGLVNLANNIIHNNPSFLPWHREFVNRYEVLLREVNPIITLLYWDWTTDPSAVGPITGSSGFMGAKTGVVGSPFTGGTPDPPNFGGIWRQQFSGTPSSLTFGLSMAYQTGTLEPSGNFDTFWSNIEGPSHNQAHGYLGGTMGGVPTAAGDPIFFMLHGNCDRLWAMWQRQNTTRWSPGHAYDPDQANANITTEMRPWNGGGIASPPMATLSPWTGLNVTHKTPLSHSVIDPPVYDDVPLTIPRIPGGDACIFEIPFYPPSPVECPSFSDPGHVCLIARIEPMDIVEGSDIGTNVKDSRRIAWRNTSVSDCSGPGPWFALVTGRIGGAGELIRNPLAAAASLTLRFDAQENGFLNAFNFGTVRVRMEPTLYQAWVNGGMQGKSIQPTGANGEVLVLASGATIAGLQLGPQAVGHMDVALELKRNYPAPSGNVYYLHLLEFTDQNGTNALGGQRYTFDFNLLNLIQPGSVWKFLDAGQIPADTWTQPGYNDGAWNSGPALFGYGRDDVETTLTGTNGRPPTAYFRNTFTVADPTFYTTLNLNVVKDDGLVVYLNAKEIARLNMPSGPITPSTPALAPVTGAAARAYYTVDVSSYLSYLLPGSNVLAAEVHPAAQKNPPELDFDLQLAGNVPPIPYQPPAVVISSPPSGSSYRVGTNVAILADVVAPDNDLTEVRIYANNVLLASLTSPPFAAVFTAPPPGGNRVSVEAQDLFGRITRMESLFTVVSNLLPTVTFTAPLNDPTFPADTAVSLAANASDADGRVAQVAFYLMGHNDPFNSPLMPVGVATSPPYSAVAAGLAPGDYNAYAVAMDNQGATSFALPVHFTMSASPGTPQLTITRQPLGDGTSIVLLQWIYPSAMLEYSRSLNGPWTALPAAGSPYGVDPTVPGSQFFRLRLQ